MSSSFIRQPMPSPTTSNVIRKPISSRKRAIDTAFSVMAPKEEQQLVSPSASTQTGLQRTKGGDYPTFSKGSSEAGDFRSAFASARKAKKKKFTWQGRSYTTERA